MTAWTRARLERALCLRFGVRAGGRPDTAAAAEALGVSRRTVQRWLRASHGRSLAHIPSRRLDQFMSMLLPAPETLAGEARQASYARKAIGGLHLPRKMGILPSWEKQRWLEQHVVVVLEVPFYHLRIRQLAVARNDSTKMAQLRRRGKVVDLAVVDTRFHATVLVHDTLTVMAPWRFQADPAQVSQGFTQAWMVERSTPATHLTQWSLHPPEEDEPQGES